MCQRGGCSRCGSGSMSWQRCFLVFCMLVIVRPTSGHSCDRARSRVARKFLDTELYPRLQELDFQLPRGCPFSKDVDMYLDNELHKKEARFNNWRCLYCNKVFKTEHYVEQHFETRHPGTILTDGVCLADYCDVLECDLHESLFEPGKTGESLHCSPNVMQRRRHRCHLVLDQCFPPHGSKVANQLHHEFEHLYCHHLTCDEAGDGTMKKRQPSEAMMVAATVRMETIGGKGKVSGGRKLLVVFAIIFLLLLFIFYLGVCLYRKDMTFAADFQKLSNARRQKRIELLKAKQF